MKHYNVAVTYQITDDIMVTVDDETKVIDLAVEKLYRRTPYKADVLVTKAEITQSWDEKGPLTVGSSDKVFVDSLKELLSAITAVDALIDDPIKEETENGV